MRNRAGRKNQGITLLEMILVLAIMSSVMLLIINYSTQRMNQFRRDKTALQMQQILNAGLAYYTSYGAWPTSATCYDLGILQGAGYLPAGTITKNPNCTSLQLGNPYALQNSSYTFVAFSANTSAMTGAGLNAYITNMQSTTQNGAYFMVGAPAPTLAEAQIIAGMLPFGQAVNDTTNSDFWVWAGVPIPGQNLNNARSVNFGAIYHHGACVPVPTCPGGMTPEILVSPAGVAGVNDAPATTQINGVPCTSSTASCAYINQYPISSFSAYATAQAAATTTSGPPSCDATGPAQCYGDISGGTWTPITTGNYWRVCLRIVTEKGLVQPTTSTDPTYGTPSGSYASPSGSFGNNTNPQYQYWSSAMGAIMAITRCVPQAGSGEPSGSDLSVSGY